MPRVIDWALYSRSAPAFPPSVRRGRVGWGLCFDNRVSVRLPRQNPLPNPPPDYRGRENRRATERWFHSRPQSPSSDNANMAFDPIVANAGRLTILTALAVEESQEFVQLRSSTKLTDGNLASHARRLRAAGLIAVEKQFRSGKPVTSFTLTPDGRKALENHTRRLVAAISHRRMSVSPAVSNVQDASPTLTKAAAVVSARLSADDEWVD